MLPPTQRTSDAECDNTEPVRSLLLTDHVQPPMLFFIVFYGLDWVAMVVRDPTPPER